MAEDKMFLSPAYKHRVHATRQEACVPGRKSCHSPRALVSEHGHHCSLNAAEAEEQPRGCTVQLASTLPSIL